MRSSDHECWIVGTPEFDVRASMTHNKFVTIFILYLNLKSSYQIASLFDMYIDHFCHTLNRNKPILRCYIYLLLVVGFQ